jgi:hypothetical protein
VHQEIIKSFQRFFPQWQQLEQQLTMKFHMLPLYYHQQIQTNTSERHTTVLFIVGKSLKFTSDCRNKSWESYQLHDVLEQNVSATIEVSITNKPTKFTLVHSAAPTSSLLWILIKSSLTCFICLQVFSYRCYKNVFWQGKSTLQME